MRFAQSAIAQFLAGGAGRLTRIAAGVLIIWLGIMLRDSGAGIALMILGLVPLAAGIFDVCVLSPLFGGPFSGERIRAQGRAGLPR